MEQGHYRLNDPRYLTEEPPKEIWKVVVDEARTLGFTKGSWCDVGAASGSFLRFLDTEFDLDESVGVDPAPELLALAANLGPEGAQWLEDSLPELPTLRGRSFDAVSCVGVLCLMDEVEPNLRALGSLVGPQGRLFVVDFINPKPVDMIMRYRLPDSPNWEMAYNTFSAETYRKAAQDLGMSVTFRSADMPFAIPESPDPMRAWTTNVGSNPFQVVSGTGQILMFTLAVFEWL